MVVSLPPPVEVEVNTLPTLPISAPPTQSGPVWSRKLRICEVMLPKRVGVPKMMPSYSASSCGSAIGAGWSIFMPAECMISSGTNSGTRLRLTCTPSIVTFDEDRTNIYKLFRATRCGPDSTIDPLDQVAFYDPGLGSPRDNHFTFGWVGRKFYNFISQATGFGITANIIDCYAALIRLWRPGDRVVFVWI